MDSAVYREISGALLHTRCKCIRFQGCDLSALKLREFANGCEDDHVSLSKLTIIDKILPADGYREISTILRITQCREMVFGDCDLSKVKLREFGFGCKECEFSLETIYVLDNVMDSAAYRELSGALLHTRCKCIVFQDCDLSVLKLNEFAKGCEDNHISISQLKLMWTEQYIVTDEMINAICELMVFVEDLKIYGCEINECGRQQLKTAFYRADVKIRHLKLPNEDYMHKESAETASNTMYPTISIRESADGCEDTNSRRGFFRRLFRRFKRN